MRTVLVALGIFLVFLSAAPFGLFAQQADLNQMARDVTAKNAADRAEAYRLAQQNGWPVKGTSPDGRVFELQKMIHNIPAYYITLNANAAKSTRTDSVNMVIGGGSGFVIREWDAGAPLITHQELTGRVTWADTDPYATHFHSTHVAGTLIASGVVAAAKGMSYQASLRAFDWTNDTGEMTTEAAAGMNLSNHSYGWIRGWIYGYRSDSYWYWFGDTAISQTQDNLFGFYDSDAQGIDQIANAAPNYLICVAASNDRGEGPVSQPVKHYYWDARYGNWRFSTVVRDKDGGAAGYDCIPDGMMIAKNVMTVGAVQDVLSYTGPSSVVMTSFSCWGPADDGRIKPDIVGNGYQLYSCTNTANNAYATYSGTSMATPNVCGSLSLLQDYYKDTHSGTAMWASTLRGLAIHTALEAGPNPGPDYMFGWGLLNTYAGYKLLNKDYLYHSKGFLQQLTINQGQTLEYKYRVYGSPPELRATICWNDPAGTPPPYSLNPRNKMLVNDLDLRIVKGATTSYPWVLDVNNPANAATKADNTTDNVEQVVVTSPSAGVYTIRITHKGTLSGGSQNFALLVSGGELNHAWHVYADGSGDAPTIASAVSQAVDGDSIYVHGGVFNEHDITVNKQLIIKGISDAGSPIIDAQSLGRCVVFPSVAKSILFDGIKMRNGVAASSAPANHGGAIVCENSLVTISNCTIYNCSASVGGGGISIDNANPTVKKCTFYSNTCGGGGGGGGGAIEISYSNSFFDSCLIYNNSATLDGGGVYLAQGAPSLLHSTLASNSASRNGGGVFVGAAGNPTLTDVIVYGGGGGGGIFGDPSATGATISCCDVYGNTGGNYGGSISDRTGTNNNISKDPIFCNAGANDYTISSISPCAPGRSPCSQLIGRFGVGCVKGPDLVIASVQFTNMQPAFGDSIRATVKIKNLGQLAATRSFYVDYYKNLSSPPALGTPGDERYLASGLAAGDSITWVTSWAKETIFAGWTSYFMVDTNDSILETNEGNNVSGPYAITWRIPQQPGWPIVTAAGFHTSPAIASIDSNETTLETVIGCDDGKLYVLKTDWTNAFGWPVTIGDTLFSSPAVADITGDYHKEIVIGGKDGKIYAFDYLGNKLWEYATGSPIYRTPALADLNRDGKCEVLCSSGSNLYALKGDGSVFSGSWPYTGAGTLTSPAVGDVDNDGTLEVAVIAYGAPSQSSVYLLKSNGTIYSDAWPAVVDTVIVADPVLGAVLGPGPALDVVAGALNGKVYVWDTAATLWSTVPRVSGSIETSPILEHMNGDGDLEIVVSSRVHIAGPPEQWGCVVTGLDNTGSVLSGWPETTDPWTVNTGPVPSPIAIGVDYEVMQGASGGSSLWSWDKLGNPIYGFPLNLGGAALGSAAADDIDRDGIVELIVASSVSPGLHCYKLSAGNYTTSQLWWPMFRHDRARTGCYSFVVPTSVDEPKNLAPKVTRLRSVYPNPFNPLARIAFDLSRTERVEIAIYDAAGRRVATVADREFTAGSHEIMWNGHTEGGSVAASGMYFCRFKAGNLTETKKIVLVR